MVLIHRYTLGVNLTGRDESRSSAADPGGTCRLYPKGIPGLSPGYLAPGLSHPTTRPEGAKDISLNRSFALPPKTFAAPARPPFSILNPLRGCNSDTAQYADTPSARFFEDEDDDENQYDSKHLVRAAHPLTRRQGLKPQAQSFHPFGISRKRSQPLLLIKTLTPPSYKLHCGNGDLRPAEAQPWFAPNSNRYNQWMHPICQKMPAGKTVAQLISVPR
jgi:hypothetical protein